jgi:hypothetical protein
MDAYIYTSVLLIATAAGVALLMLWVVEENERKDR